MLYAALVPAAIGATATLLHAETLPEALKAAYHNNPTLRAERERQKATDEQVPQALSGWRPTVIANGDAGAQNSTLKHTRDSKTNPAGISITLTQPVFNGFRTVAGTRQATANVEAGRQQLLSVQQQVLLDAASAYMDVIRDRRIVTLRRRNVRALREQLNAANARFSVGEITRTDVAQARARLSLAEAEQAVSKSNLNASNAVYQRVVGRAPGKLTFPPVSRRVPKSLDAALAIARQVNPRILAAAFNAESARHNIDVQKGNLLPTVSLEADYSLRHEPNNVLKSAEVATIRGTVSIPLYQAGRVYSQIREAKHTENQRKMQVLEADRQVRESVASTWSAFLASGDTIRSLRAQVDANRLALDGVRQEALVGTRTTLDVLDAERELVLSEVDLVRAERNQIVAAYQLLASIGRMTAGGLGLAVEAYEPAANYEQVRDKWFGASVKSVE